MYTIFILEQDTFLTQPIPYKVYIAWFPPMKTSPNTFSRALRSLPLQFPTQGRVGGGERWTISEAMYTSAFCKSLGIFLRTFWCAGHWGVRWKKDFAFYNYKNLDKRNVREECTTKIVEKQQEYTSILFPQTIYLFLLNVSLFRRFKNK